MANFLDDLSIYNAKAAAAISAAVVECNNEKANMMSSLKTTANDITLSEEIRLNALTALINLGNLLDIPLPPYFPSVTTYALTETFVGVHNDLDGLQGGAPGEYYHLTAAEKTAILNKASIGDITWAQLGGVYSDNDIFGPQFDAKQDGLVAPTSATYFLKVSGNVVSYDNNVYLSSIEGIEAGGELEGTYRSPTLSNAAVIGKVLTGFDPFASVGAITSSDTILSAIEKLNANIDSVIANPSGVASVAFSNNAVSVFTTTASPSTGAASLNLSLNSQTANLVLASPNATTGQPSFRALVAADLPNSGVTAATYGSSTVIPQIQVDAKGRITSVTAITAASGGQVNTITLAVPSFLGLSSINNTLPASPQIVLQLATQTANTVFAGPATGAAAAPTFRLLVEDDIPQLSTSKITNLTNILNNFLTNNLSDGSIWIGNTSNAAVPRVLSGDVTVSNTGVTAIGLAKVQYDMIQNVTTQTLLGNYELTDGPVQQITLSADFVLNSGSGVLSLAVPVAPVVTTKGDLLGHDLISQQRVPSNNVDGSILLVNNSATGAYTDLGLNWVAMSGDATITASGAITIANNAVTLGKIQQLPAFTVIGNATSTNPATPTALSKTELTTLVNQFTTSLSGVVPAASFTPVAPNVLSDYFLNAAGGWTVPAGGGGGGTTTNALTIGGGLLSSIAPTVTFNGSAAVTISLNTGNANTWTALQTFENNIYVGAASGLAGSVRFRGSTSGYVILQAPASPANQTYILPTATGTTGQFLKLSDDTTGQLAWDTAGSGSGTVVSGNQYNLAYYSVNPTGTTVSALGSLGTSSQVLHGNASGIPTWGAVALASDVSGTLPVGNGGTGATTLTGVVKASGASPFTAGTVSLASEVSGTLITSNGGTGVSTYTAGDILYYSTGTALTKLGIGSVGQILTVAAGSALTWSSGLVNPMITLGDIITAAAGGVAKRLGIGGSGTFLGVVAGEPAWTTPTASTPLNQITAAAAGVATPVNHNASTVQWNWNSNTTTNALVFNSTGITTGAILAVTHATSAFTGAGGIVAFSSTGITSGNLLTLGISGTTATSADNLVITNSSTANTSGRGLDISITGATTSGNTFGAFISNTKTGATSTNTALSLTASGATTNYALDVTAGIVRMAASTASIPHMLFTPGVALTATTNGMFSYATDAGNSSFYFYKDSSVTKLISLDRNPDLAIGSANGVVISDVNGSLSKSADLTALGIYAQTNDVTVVNTTTPTTIIGTVTGSATLPANFFGVGKTIIIFVSGTYAQTSSSNTCTLNFSIGGVAIGSIALQHGNSLSTTYFEARIVATCRTTGASGTVQYQGCGLLNLAGTPEFYYITSATSGSINTTTTNAINVTATWLAANPSNSLVVGIHTAQYIN